MCHKTMTILLTVLLPDDLLRRDNQVVSTASIKSGITIP